MLNDRRQSLVTMGTGNLQRAGLICQYRGAVEIVDRESLEAQASRR
jgi:hypothetical protein